MLDMLKTLINGLLEIVKGFKGDWKENDPNSPNYIKNRTHWVEESKEEVIFNTSFTSYNWYVDFPINFSLELGKEYTVNWNNETYTFIAESDGYVIGMGNRYAFDDGYNNTGEPFYIIDDDGYLVIFMVNGGTYNVSISTIVEKVHKLDKKFIDVPDVPDNVITEENLYDNLENMLAPVSFTNSYSSLSGKPNIYYDVVRYDTTVSLSNTQKTRARNNIGAGENISASFGTFPTSPQKTHNVSTLSSSLYDEARGVHRIRYTQSEGRFNEIFKATYEPIIKVQGFNNKDYYYTLSSITVLNGEVKCFGNKALYSVEEPDTGEPFLFMEANNYDLGGIYFTTDATISLYYADVNNVQQLNELLIPDTIARTADLNQIDAATTTALNDLTALVGDTAVSTQISNAISGIEETLDDALFMGVNSTTIELPITGSWHSVDYYKGKYIALAASTDVAAYSSDAVNWTAMTMPASVAWRETAHNNDVIVAVSSSQTAAYSSDGVNWTGTNMPSDATWRSVTYGDGKFVAVAHGSSKAAYSIDGITWESAVLPSSQKWISVTYGNGVFVAVAYNTDVAAYSTDGISWTDMIMPRNTSWQFVTYGGGTFVAVAQGISIGAYSTDGTHWTYVQTSGNVSWASVVYGDGKFVGIAGRTTTAMTSVDGITWTKTAMPLQKEWMSITYGDGKFVAVAYTSNTAVYSTDGETWVSTRDDIYLADFDGVNVTGDIRTLIMGQDDYALSSEVATQISEAIEGLGGVGEDVAGREFTYTNVLNGNQVTTTAAQGAEIFNDYSGNIAIGQNSHAEGISTQAIGNYSHAEGYQARAIGNYTHAEGFQTVVDGRGSHAEGWGSVAREDASHAEGMHTRAFGEASHAEGIESETDGKYSHVEGRGTYIHSKGTASHVQGKYNLIDTEGKYAHIVGNGTSKAALSNAHTIDWDGNAWFAGDIYLGGTGQDDTNAKKLITEDEVSGTYATKAEVTNLVGDTPVSEQINAAISALEERLSALEISAIMVHSGSEAAMVSTLGEDGDVYLVTE